MNFAREHWSNARERKAYARQREAYAHEREAYADGRMAYADEREAYAHRRRRYARQRESRARGRKRFLAEIRKLFPIIYADAGEIYKTAFRLGFHQADADFFADLQAFFALDDAPVNRRI
jgi:hypothetical protein